MQYFSKAVRFFSHVRSNRGIGAQERKRSVLIGDGLWEADVYAPVPGLFRLPKTILLVHGMAAIGNKDPRMAALALALARCGYIVIAPFFKDISGFEIRHQTVADIVRVIEAVTRDSELCPDGRLSIFAPSFSAGMSLIAAARPQVAHYVNAVCVVGSYCRVEPAIAGLLARQDDDDYGRLIVLKNFLPFFNGFNKQVDDALYAAILDNGLERENPEFPRHLDRLPATEKGEIQRLLNDPAYRIDWWRTLSARSSDVREMCRRLSVLPRLDGLRAPVAILHGAGDRVIPCEESVALHRHLQTLRVSTRLSVTRLLSHGDILGGLSLVWDVAGVLRTLAFFFKHSERACHKSETTENAFSPAFGDVSIPSEVCRPARISTAGPAGPGDK